jgi:hypothetical protein
MRTVLPVLEDLAPQVSASASTRVRKAAAFVGRSGQGALWQLGVVVDDLGDLADRIVQPPIAWRAWRTALDLADSGALRPSDLGR